MKYPVEHDKNSILRLAGGPCRNKVPGRYVLKMLDVVTHRVDLLFDNIEITVCLLIFSSVCMFERQLSKSFDSSDIVCECHDILLYKVTKENPADRWEEVCNMTKEFPIRSAEHEVCKTKIGGGRSTLQRSRSNTPRQTVRHDTKERY